MSCFNNSNPTSERCRFCGIEVSSDPVTMMAHFNNHWRHYNIESLPLSPCAFESQLDIRVGTNSINPEDLEVSGHMEHSFQYTYSPQTEPSNLTIAGARCSPLNLTGKAKPSSPLSSPLPAHMPISPVQQHANVPITTANHVGSMQSQSVFQMEMINNTSDLNHQLPIPNQIPETLDMSCHVASEELEKRKRKTESIQEIRCPDCNKLFFSKAAYHEHMQTHIVKPNRPSNQYLMSTEQVDMNQTVDNAICSFSEKSYKCSICDQEFTYREELLEHSESHEAAKPHKCDTCGARLSHISALRRHKLTHGGHKPHQCSVCNRAFFHKCDLQRHYSIHGKTKHFECSVCNKKFSSSYYLKSHKCKPPDDDNNNPFKCNICGKGCANNMAWSYHMWRHTKNPVFVQFQDK